MIDLTDLHRRWIFTLEIAGLAYRYTSHSNATPATIQGHPTAATYTDIPCVVDVGSIRSSIDLAGGIAEHGSCTVTLAERPGLAGDPAEIFSLIGRRSATTAAQATSSLAVDATLPYDLTVDRDLSAHAPGTIHLGQELVYITAAGGTDPDPDDADPYTVTISARGLGGTRIRAHIATPEEVDFPTITAPEVVFWRTRPARILVEDARRPGDPIEIFRGFIESTPDPKGDGTTIPIEITPLSVLFDKAAEIRAPAAKTRLVEGYHLFADGAASVFEVYQRQNELSGGIRDNTALNSTDIDVTAADAEQWSASFDEDRRVGHPRAGGVVIGNRGRAYDVNGTSIDGGADPETLDLVDGPDLALTTAMRWSTRPACEAKRAYLIEPGDDPEILVWPGTSDDGLDGAFGRINDQLDVADHTGIDGAAFGVRLDAAIPDRALRILRNVAANGVQEPFFPIVTFGFDRDANRDGRYAPRSIAELWPRAEVGPPPSRWIVDGIDVERPVADTRELLWYPFEWALLGRTRLSVPGAEPDVWFFKGGSPNRAEEWMPVHDISRAFYQRGEPYMLVEDNLDISDGRIAVRVDKLINTTAGRTVERIAFEVAVSAITPVVLAVGPRSGDTIYQLTLTRPQDVRSFGVWTAEGVVGSVEVFGGAEAETVLGRRESASSTIGEALEWLLMSPATLGLTADDVDVPSLHRFAAPWLPSFYLGALGADPGLTYADVIGSILRMTGTALVMRTAAGQTRLTRIHVGIEIATEVAERIEAGDWATEPRPKWGRDDDLINAIEVAIEYGLLDDDPKAFRDMIEFRDRASISAHDEGRSVRIDDYSGLAYPEPAVDLAAMAQRIFRTFGAPRRTFSGRVGTYKGIPLGVGAVAAVTSPHLRAYKAPKGVVAATARIVEQELDLWRDGCALTMVHYGASGAGWAPSARVASVVSPLIVTVDANAYSDALHPVTGLPQEDLDHFSASDEVRCEPFYDIDGYTTRSIVTIDRATRTVTLDGAHGLAVGDSLIPTIRANAPEAHRLYAYLGDGESDVQELV